MAAPVNAQAHNFYEILLCFSHIPSNSSSDDFNIMRDGVVLYLLH